MGQPFMTHALPEFFMEEVSHGIAGWLDQGNSSANCHAARHRITDGKGDGKMNSSKRKRFFHDGLLDFDENHYQQRLIFKQIDCLKESDRKYK